MGFVQRIGTPIVRASRHSAFESNGMYVYELSRMQTRRDGPSLRICMAVNRSTTRIAPPQTGHCQTAVSLLADDTTVGGTGANNLRHSGNNSLRRRVASQPKQRMRGRPLGRTC